MIGSSLYFIALLATAEVETTDINATQETTQAIATEHNNTAEPIATPVTLSNNIEPTMLKYKHWTGTYSPDTFNMCVNGILVAPGETCVISNPTEPFSINFDYSFMNGMRTGSKTFSCTINENSTHIALTFSWLEPNKIILDNATVTTT